MVEDITGIGKLAEKLPELTQEIRDLIKAIFQPGAEELGGLIGDYFKRVRYINAIRGLAKTQKLLVKEGIEPRPVKIKLLAPIIEGMSLEEEENLQEIWARLLVESIKEPETHPNYPNILKSLSSLDVQILNCLLKYKETFYISSKFSDQSFAENFPEAVNYLPKYGYTHASLVATPSIKNKQAYKEFKARELKYVHKTTVNEYERISECLANYYIKQPLSMVKSSINHLCSLGLCTIEVENIREIKSIRRKVIKKLYLTYFGEDFLSKITSP